MKGFSIVIIVSILSLLMVFVLYYTINTITTKNLSALNNMDLNLNNGNIIYLPEPDKQGNIPLEKAINQRRSIRQYKNEPLTIQEISQLLWSAQGITDITGKRTAPSAGALHPLETYLLVNRAEKITSGIYRYLPTEHGLIKIIEGNFGQNLKKAALGQEHAEKAAIAIFFSGVFERTTQKYGDRGVNYVYIEAGHAAQNIYLQAQTLELGTVAIGAFSDDEIKNLFQLSLEETPLYLMTIGRI